MPLSEEREGRRNHCAFPNNDADILLYAAGTLASVYIMDDFSQQIQGYMEILDCKYCDFLR